MTAIFAAAANSCEHGFFFIPHWWEFLTTKPTPTNGCQIAFTFPGDILPVALAIVDMILRLAGLVAIVSIMISGVIYMTAGGDFAKTASAKTRIYNSMIGLGIVTLAAGIVYFIGNALPSS